MAVASTHQSGRSAATMRRASVALRRSPNKAKQVAPDPDIPVALASGICDNLSRTTAIAGAMPTAAASRSFRLEARKSRMAAVPFPSASNDLADDSSVEPRREPERSENLWRRRLDLGVDENGEHLWQRDQWTELIADAGHHSGLRTKAGENVRSRRHRRSAHAADRRPTIGPRRRATARPPRRPRTLRQVRPRPAIA